MIEWLNIPSVVFGFAIGVLVTLLFVTLINIHDEGNDNYDQ